MQDFKIQGLEGKIFPFLHPFVPDFELKDVIPRLHRFAEVQSFPNRYPARITGSIDIHGFGIASENFVSVPVKNGLSFQIGRQSLTGVRIINQGQVLHALAGQVLTGGAIRCPASTRLPHLG